MLGKLAQPLPEVRDLDLDPAPARLAAVGGGLARLRLRPSSPHCSTRLPTTS